MVHQVGRQLPDPEHDSSHCDDDEEGPEIFRPRSSGTIIPNDRAAPAAPARAGLPGMVMRNFFNISGAGDPEAVAQRVAAVLDQKYREAVGGLYTDYGLDTA